MNSRRIYRRQADELRFNSFQLSVKETDLWVAVNSEGYNSSLPEKVEQFVFRERRLLEAYLAAHPLFKTALQPCLAEPGAPLIVRKMIRAANLAKVGPMAAVAGAMAEAVGLFLADDFPEVIIENGGDIYIRVSEPVSIGIYAGSSPLSSKLALRIDPANTPLGICTSSGTVGPSLSRGSADAAVVTSPSAPLADAVATGMGNLVKNSSDLEEALDYACEIAGVEGALIVYKDKVAARGNIELVNS